MKQILAMMAAAEILDENLLTLEVRKILDLYGITRFTTHARELLPQVLKRDNLRAYGILLQKKQLVF